MLKQNEGNLETPLGFSSERIGKCKKIADSIMIRIIAFIEIELVGN